MAHLRVICIQIFGDKHGLYCLPRFAPSCRLLDDCTAASDIAYPCHRLSFLVSLDVYFVLDVASVGESGLSQTLEKKNNGEDRKDKSDESGAVWEK